jgi:hypothetical protein
VKDGKNILADMFGNIMSEPTRGEFSWKWDAADFGSLDIVITNETLGKRWRTDDKTRRMKEI